MMLSSSGQVLGQSKDLQAELAEGLAEQAAGQANQCGAEERVGEAAQPELSGGHGDKRLDVHQGELATGDRLDGDAGPMSRRVKGTLRLLASCVLAFEGIPPGKQLLVGGDKRGGQGNCAGSNEAVGGVAVERQFC
jgi:hypothetical protein